MASVNMTIRARSASTTSASTSSLSGPRARLSAITAMVTVGEKLTTSVASSAASVTRARPVASGSSGSHGHASQPSANRPVYINPS